MIYANFECRNRKGEWYAVETIATTQPETLITAILNILYLNGKSVEWRVRIRH